MQQDTLGLRTAAILCIPDDRMSHMCQMDTDLMGTSGSDLNVHFGLFALHLFGLDQCMRLFTAYRIDH